MGVDGCGAPTFRGTVRSLAKGFSRLSTDGEFARIAEAVDRFMPLVAATTRPDGVLGVNWPGPSKAGAEGCIALSRHGVAIATKSLEGNGAIAAAAAPEVAAEHGHHPESTLDHKDQVRHPQVQGGGKPEGHHDLVPG